MFAALAVTELLLAISLANAQSALNDTVYTSCIAVSGWWDELKDKAGNDLCDTTGSLVADLCSASYDKPACLCYHEVYYMFAVCAACQMSSQVSVSAFPSYATWNQGCRPAVTSPSFNFTGDVPWNLLPSWIESFKLEDYPDFTIDAAVNLSQGIMSNNSSNVASTSTLPASPSSSPEAPAKPASNISNTASKSNAGAIAGGIVGGLALIGLLVFLVLLFVRRRKTNRVAPSSEFTQYMQQPVLARPPTRPDLDPSKSSPTTRATPSTLSPQRTLPSPPGQPGVDELPAFTPGHYTGPIFEKGGYVANPNVPPYAAHTSNHAAMPLR